MLALRPSSLKLLEMLRLLLRATRSNRVCVLSCIVGTTLWRLAVLLHVGLASNPQMRRQIDLLLLHLLLDLYRLTLRRESPVTLHLHLVRLLGLDSRMARRRGRQAGSRKSPPGSGMHWLARRNTYPYSRLMLLLRLRTSARNLSLLQWNGHLPLLAGLLELLLLSLCIRLKLCYVCSRCCLALLLLLHMQRCSFFARYPLRCLLLLLLRSSLLRCGCPPNSLLLLLSLLLTQSLLVLLLLDLLLWRARIGWYLLRAGRSDCSLWRQASSALSCGRRRKCLMLSRRTVRRAMILLNALQTLLLLLLRLTRLQGRRILLLHLALILICRLRRPLHQRRWVPEVERSSSYRLRLTRILCELLARRDDYRLPLLIVDYLLVRE